MNEAKDHAKEPEPRVNWATATVVAIKNIGPIKALIILIFGLGTATNAEVQNAVKTVFGIEQTIDLPAGQTADLDPNASGDAFQANTAQAIKAINAELAAVKRRIGNVNAHTNKHDAEQDARLAHIEGLVQ